ncbi:hypothetical protein STXM2123_1780 [Streptomyces sp. F-3]|nr:hypothetical protein STXM2123_1780 [Streptomyces sp. F-3]
MLGELLGFGDGAGEGLRGWAACGRPVKADRRRHSGSSRGRLLVVLDPAGHLGRHAGLKAVGAGFGEFGPLQAPLLAPALRLGDTALYLLLDVRGHSCSWV